MAKQPAREKLTEDEIRERTEANRLSPPEPEDLQEYKGRYRHLATGDIFGLKVLHGSEVRQNKTHHAKSARMFWDGTPEEFRAQFDKA
jgi:hypothetical protein